MALIEFKYNGENYRLRMLSDTPMVLEEVRKEYVGDLFRDAEDIYYRLQRYDPHNIGPGTTVLYTSVLSVSYKLFEKVHTTYPNLNLIPAVQYDSNDFKITPIVDDITISTQHDSDTHYVIIDNYILTEAYVPPYTSVSDFITRTQVQYYDTVTKKLYNLEYTLPLGQSTRHAASIYVNKSTKDLDIKIIEIAKTSHKLNLIRVI